MPRKKRFVDPLAPPSEEVPFPKRRTSIQRPKRRCSYCDRNRAVTSFKEGSDICKFCEVFDRAANITSPYR